MTLDPQTGRPGTLPVRTSALVGLSGYKDSPPGCPSTMLDDGREFEPPDLLHGPLSLTADQLTALKLPGQKEKKLTLESTADHMEEGSLWRRILTERGSLSRKGPYGGGVLTERGSLWRRASYILHTLRTDCRPVALEGWTPRRSRPGAIRQCAERVAALLDSNGFSTQNFSCREVDTEDSTKIPKVKTSVVFAPGSSFTPIRRSCSANRSSRKCVSGKSYKCVPGPRPLSSNGSWCLQGQRLRTKKKSRVAMVGH